MRRNLLTLILLATILVEASCLVQQPQNRRRLNVGRNRLLPTLRESTTPGSCIIPNWGIGVWIVRSSCGPSCNTIRGRSVPDGTTLHYNCRNGYMIMNGSGRTICNNGYWDETPRCWKTCHALASNTVDIICRLWGENIPCQPQIPPGTVASLRCTWPHLFPFARGEGYTEITCRANGTWNRPPYECLLAF